MATHSPRILRVLLPHPRCSSPPSSLRRQLDFPRFFNRFCRGFPQTQPDLQTLPLRNCRVETHHRGDPRGLVPRGVLAGALLAAASRGIFLFLRGGGGIERDLDCGAESGDDDADRGEAKYDDAAGDFGRSDGSVGE